MDEQKSRVILWLANNDLNGRYAFKMYIIYFEIDNIALF